MQRAYYEMLAVSCMCVECTVAVLTDISHVHLHQYVVMCGSEGAQSEA